jgi:hypothetical protein
MFKIKKQVKLRLASCHNESSIFRMIKVEPEGGSAFNQLGRDEG